MPHNNAGHLPLYEVDEDPKRHWIVCEKIWDATDITNKAKQLAQFVGALRRRALTWFMNFTENRSKSKSDI